ncbi:hypothetical protein C7W93_13265 [Glaciimonas sp. PCH181]|nr:hypothetical protein C7W93_13265 [Glaciimonas sp. PCH181]
MAIQTAKDETAYSGRIDIHQLEDSAILSARSATFMCVARKHLQRFGTCDGCHFHRAEDATLK